MEETVRGNKTIKNINAYIPQTELDEETKTKHINNMATLMKKFLNYDQIFLGRLNGHVGRYSGNFDRLHGDIVMVHGMNKGML